VRVGDHIWVAGTAPFTPDGEVTSPGDLAGQTTRCIEIIAEALAGLGAELRHVVITRMFVTDITRAAELSEAHRNAFGAHPPASTLIEAAALVHPDVLIEIEAEAVVRDDD
jgi:enamine deaminase RidA (YjgF/YER057c/UK114 family)